jgi:hypothetical protein
MVNHTKDTGYRLIKINKEKRHIIIVCILIKYLLDGICKITKIQLKINNIN